MKDFNLRKDEIEFIDRDLKKRGFSWDEINFRKTKLRMQLKKVKEKLHKKDLTPEELNLIFKEEFSKMVESCR